MTSVDTPIDLDAYFARIGYTGPRTASLVTLQALHQLHPQAIAFENLNPLLRLPVRLDSASLQAKLVQGRRGGWCFEHNLLFMRVLQQLGFKVDGLAARVLWRQPADTINPRSHMLLRIELDAIRWIADVGFGGLTLTGPLQLGNGAQGTPHEPFRLQPLAEGYQMQAQLDGDWAPLYRFDLNRQHLPDYEVSNWYLCHHPNSLFVNDLMAARPTPTGRLSLNNNEFVQRTLQGGVQRRTLSSVAQLRQVLDEAFDLAVPAGADADAALAKLIR